MSEPVNSSIFLSTIDNSTHSSVRTDEIRDKVVSNNLFSKSRPSSPDSFQQQQQQPSSSSSSISSSVPSSSRIPSSFVDDDRAFVPSSTSASPKSFPDDFDFDDDWSHSEEDDVYFLPEEVPQTTNLSSSRFFFGGGVGRSFLPTEFHSQNNCQRSSGSTSFKRSHQPSLRSRRKMLHNTNENNNHNHSNHGSSSSSNYTNYTIKESSSSTSSNFSDTSSIDSHLAQKWEAIELTHNERSIDSDTYKMDIARARFPFAILWTPIPVLTWIFPFIGHMGICDSRGVAYDFAGPYSIGIDDLAFGLPTRYLLFNPEHISMNKRREFGNDKTVTQIWDNAVDIGCEVYSGRMHNLCCDNCHSHVARCLNVMQYNNRSNWNMVTLAILMFIKGKYVTTGRMISMWFPFIIFVILILSLRYSLFRY